MDHQVQNNIWSKKKIVVNKLKEYNLLYKPTNTRNGCSGDI